MFLLSTAFLIMLSVVVTGASVEPRRCYWCGPLAEQVHRSRRAPPCSAPAAPGQVTVCEPGLTYCAVVATSPPHVESRYCVKSYQDECYAVFCNSTKTWKMTCPCYGDLCNGANTERELEAFATLAHLVAKTHSSRIKKSALRSFMSSQKRNNQNELTDKSAHSNQTMHSENGLVEQNNAGEEFDKDESTTYSQTNTYTLNGMEMSTNDNMYSTPNTHKVMNEPTQDVNTNDNSEMQSDQPANEPEESDPKNEKFVTSTDIIKLHPNDDNKVVQASMETETTIELSSNSYATTETPKNSELPVTYPEIVSNYVKPIEELPTAEALLHDDNPTEGTPKVLQDMEPVVKPREEMPTAEALLHDDNPTERAPKVLQNKEPFEETTPELTTVTTTTARAKAADTKPVTTKEPKGDSVRFFLHNLIHLSCAILIILQMN